MLNSQFKEVGEKMLAVMKTEMSNIVESETKASYIAPREVEYSLVENKLPPHLKNRKGKKCRIYIHKGEYYNLTEMCSLFRLNYSMVLQRIHNGWNLLRVFGVENHRVDNYIKENMEEMKK
jgi:Holliday junction resolvase